jgi:hypothetical protein
MGDGQREALHHLRRAQDPVRSASDIAAGSETSNPRRLMEYLPAALRSVAPRNRCSSGVGTALEYRVHIRAGVSRPLTLLPVFANAGHPASPFRCALSAEPRQACQRGISLRRAMLQAQEQ